MTQRRLSPISRFLALSLAMSMVLTPSHGQTFEGDGPPVVIPKIDMSLGGMMGNASVPGTRRLDVNSATPAIRGGTADDRIGPALGQGMAPLKPMPPNDFQRFVLESTGQALPLFGMSLFSQAGGSYQPLANTPVSPDYTLGTGDEVLIRGWGSVDIDVKAVVDRNGLIHIPRIGAVSLAGVKSSQVEGVVHVAISRYFKDFQLSVTLGQLRGITVYIVGQARKPGAYTLSSVSTLVSALFASGGPGPNGSMRRVQVKRSDKQVAEIDIYKFLSKGDKSSDVRLQDGDTIVIPAATGYVALVGKVNESAVYELSGSNDTVESILAMAGGMPALADPKRATLERVDSSKKPPRSVESFALDARGLKRSLRNGDLLTVSAVTPEFGNAVMLRGNVDQPVRLPWFQGMTVRDLIPNKADLLSRASVKRQNEALLSADERRRANDADFSSAEASSGASMRGSERVSRDTADSLAQRIGNLVDEINLDYAVIERVDKQDVSVKLLPFALGKALEDARSPENLPLQSGDIVTVFSVNDVRVPVGKRQVFVRVEGEVAKPGVYQVRPGDTLQGLLDQAGGLTPDAYLFGAELYREDVRQAQTKNLDQLVRRLESQLQTRLSAGAASATSGDANLAQFRLQAEAQAQRQALDRLKSLKPSGRIMLGFKAGAVKVTDLPTLRLESQDRLIVPARPDFVHVLGSVNTESALIWKAGQSVQYYLDQSGLTSGADKDELFIVRADGSVVTGNGRWFGGISSEKVQPGDLIVLPEKTDHESGWSIFTRNAKDITQIIYQFSLGAAAIKTLRN